MFYGILKASCHPQLHIFLLWLYDNSFGSKQPYLSYTGSWCRPLMHPLSETSCSLPLISVSFPLIGYATLLETQHLHRFKGLWVQSDYLCTCCVHYIKHGHVFMLARHFITYPLPVPNWTPFTFRTALMLRETDSKTCWKFSSEILVHIDTIASHSQCRFVSCIHN